jgi:hypothetical protein
MGNTPRLPPPPPCPWCQEPAAEIVMRSEAKGRVIVYRCAAHGVYALSHDGVLATCTGDGGVDATRQMPDGASYAAQEAPTGAAEES